MSVTTVVASTESAVIGALPAVALIGLGVLLPIAVLLRSIQRNNNPFGSAQRH